MGKILFIGRDIDGDTSIEGSLLNHFSCWDQIRISRDDNDLAGLMVDGIGDHGQGDVDVSLLFLLVLIGKPEGALTGFAGTFPFGNLSLNQLEVRQGREGFPVPLLAVALFRVLPFGIDLGGKIFNGNQVVIGAEELEQAPTIKPFILGVIFEHAVVQVEPVDVGVANGAWREIFWRGRVFLLHDLRAMV